MTSQASHCSFSPPPLGSHVNQGVCHPGKTDSKASNCYSVAEYLLVG